MSKRVFQHPPEAETGRKYWRSLGQLANTEEFRGWLEREFPQGAAEFKGGEVSRRNFIQLMGASAALAGFGLSACRRPEKHLVPFTKGVEWSIPGKALFFATSMPHRKGAQPLMVATYDGRPVKIEGNPIHPAVKGATDTWSQASILDLYDPDRSRDFLHFTPNPATKQSEWRKADAATFEKALDAVATSVGDGGGLAFLLEECNSPTRERLRAEIEKKFPKALWAVYEPTGGTLANAGFGNGVEVIPQIDKADVVMALDCDFLSCSDSTVQAIREFTSRRKVEGPDTKMNRLYVVENRYTVTGGMADHRLRLPASQVGAFAVELARAVGAQLPAEAQNAQVPALPINPEWLKQSAADLVASKGKALVLVGSRQPAAVHAIVAAINQALGGPGATLAGRKTATKPAATISQVAESMQNGTTKAIIIVGGNPAYNAPADLGWANLQRAFRDEKGGTVIRIGYHEDETSQLATWHAPLAHYLESWGDALATDGSYVSVQPMILPLFGGWSELDVLAKLAGRPKPTGPELVQETFRQVANNPGDFTAAWAKLLHDGFLAESAAKPEGLSPAGAQGGLTLPPYDENSFEVVLVADSKVDDGRFVNNGWLQEQPDAITKLTWDNAAWISPASAKKLGVETGNIVEVSVADRKLRIPVIEAPGHADNSLTIPLGYGREVVGRVGRGTGFNAYPLMTSTQPYFVTGAKVTKTGDAYPLAITQEHGTLEGRGADLTREANFDTYKVVASAPQGSEEREYFKKMGMDSHIPKNVSLYSHPPLADIHAWGMTIDLNTCIGCSACMIACQAENNVPIVGKEQVIEGREMHWLRMDRYFASDDSNPDNPEMVSEPMLCQHCENAPCETVCPVNATVHSEDGLNVMAYNRCIGTRYCANNCPYKVRRFNFFDYNQRDVLGTKIGVPFTGLKAWNLTAPKGTPDTIKMRNNPNVTVRMRGVMEKCTFCVQRIQEAKMAAKVYARDSDQVPRVPADAFTVACAQACPTDAIVFGDINNKESRVSKIKESERGYRLLEYLNTNTRIWYLARIRNPNPKMPDAARMGAAVKGHDHHGPDDPHKADKHGHAAQSANH